MKTIQHAPFYIRLFSALSLVVLFVFATEKATAQRHWNNHRHHRKVVVAPPPVYYPPPPVVIVAPPPVYYPPPPVYQCPPPRPRHWHRRGRRW